MYATRFTVQGSGVFPLDMLRYDACHPVYEVEIGRLVERREHRQVTLATVHPRKGENRLTDARWRSFGWRIVGTETAVRVD